MWFSSDHMVVTTTGFCFSTQQRSAFASLLTARTPAGSVASVVAPLFVVTSRSARAESKRQSQRDPAVYTRRGRDFDPQREQGARAGLSKRDLPSSRWPASAGLQHPNKLKMHNDAGPGLLPPRYEIIPPGRGPGAVSMPVGWAWGPIWGRGNESRLRGCPPHPPPGTGPSAESNARSAA